ncbi:unnamed protein product [Rotaria sordida]|uniref:Nuclear receptor domain-containing protein n=1 Tax=Rotaria sordida TaxID=392033 RepID=A0A816BNM2_9BILA|nr:unnamed protein product [Rotaria sordida]CAF1610004.1 unnamed protein product [Rotaria sordida]
MSSTIKKSKIFQGVCEICGVPAEYNYFGVISCNACKMFFKRNAESGQTAFVCNFGGQCEININTRHVCSSCRLTKCFKCGMDIEKFRASRQSEPKRRCLVKLPTLNLLRSDQSLLTTNQWTLLSNLCNSYNESQILPFSERLTHIHDTSQFSCRAYTVLIEEFLASIYETTRTYLCSNDDLRRLSGDDRSVILRSAADYVSCMGGTFIMQYYHLYDLDGFLNAMNAKYGKSLMDVHIWSRKFIDPNIVLAKLSISMFAFSEDSCSYYSNISSHYTNSITILQIQNKYAELTWKYLLYKYGLHDAVNRFLNITLWLCSMHILAFHAQSLANHVSDVDSVIEKTELKLILDDIDEMDETNQ